jgi:hypothetical protein
VTWSADASPTIVFPSPPGTSGAFSTPGTSDSTGLETLPGTQTTIAGHAAKVDTELGQDCRQMGGERSITAFIKRDATDNYFRVTACFRGPHLRDLEAQVRSMLASAKLASANPTTTGQQPARKAFSFVDNLPQSDPAAWAFDNLAAVAQQTCPGTVWPATSAPPPGANASPYAMVVIQVPGRCDPPPPGSPPYSRPTNASPSGTYLIHLDSCRDASALDVTIDVDANYGLHLVSEKAAPRTAHPACQ